MREIVESLEPTFILEHQSSQRQHRAGDHGDGACESCVHQNHILLQGICRDRHSVRILNLHTSTHTQQKDDNCVTFCVPTESDEGVSYFHQQTVGVLTRSDRHFLGTNNDLKQRTTS